MKNHVESEPNNTLTLTDLLRMDGQALGHVMQNGHPIEQDSLDDSVYLGVDLSLPPLLSRLLWETFCKTFHREPKTGDLRGWNVKLEQHGVDGPIIPLKDRHGQAITFGHYRVRSAENRTWPWGWRGADYLDYTVAGNSRLDPGGYARTPLVAVNSGSSNLLLGWEVFSIAGRLIPMRLYWALERARSLEVHDIVPVPRPARVPQITSSTV